MKQNEPGRVRFVKPYRLMSQTSSKPQASLAEMFVCFPLQHFCKNIRLWQQLALSNDQSMYDNAASREDLIDFCRELQHLADAFAVLNQKHRQKRPAYERKSAAAPPDPLMTIDRFCHRFLYDYARTEILDLLEAVITYNGVKKISRANLVLFYQCLDFMIDLAYNLSRPRQCLEQMKRSMDDIRHLKQHS